MSDESSKEVARWADESMFRAEESVRTEETYIPKATLLDAPSDPLGKLAAIAKAYQGKFPLSYADVSDDDRLYYVQDMEKNILGMPSESVMFHFVLENVTRSFTHQLVRTRHACLSGDTRVIGGSYHSDRNEHNPTIRDLYENRKLPGGTKQIKIRTVNESGIIVRNKIKEIWSVGVKDVFLLKTHDGREIKATANHPFQRPDGTFSRLDELVVGDFVMSNGVELVADESWLKERVESGMSTLDIAELANCSTSHVKKYRRRFGIPGVGGFASISQEQRVINSSRAGSTPQKKWSAEAKARFSEQCKRERNKNPENYAGVDPGHRAAQALFAHKYEDPCAWCGGRSEELAHVDGNPLNNEDGNVQGMCIPCHRAMDRGTYPESVYPSTIISIEPAGSEEVFDLEMDGEYPWFVANGLIVHNSYAQESMRFAVKEDFPVQLPPSLDGTISRRQWRVEIAQKMMLKGWQLEEHNMLLLEERHASSEQRMRFVWDETVSAASEGYLKLIEMGMPAEDARGLAPHNIVTRLNWVIDLRSLMQVAGQRLCTQAQWEHRMVWDSVIREIREFGSKHVYTTTNPFEWSVDDLFKDGEKEDLFRKSRDTAHPGSYSFDELADQHGRIIYQRSSSWQFEFLARRFKPICYQTGRCQFRSDFDRYCNIRDRVEDFNFYGIEPSEWDKEHVVMNSGPVKLLPIHPLEWLDPNAAIREDGSWRSEEAQNNIRDRR